MTSAAVTAPEPARPRLSVRGVSKRFEAVRALSGVSFDLAPGEIHSLVGENGAGKSTLVGIVTGLLEPDGGELLLDGEPVRFRNPRDARAADIAAVLSATTWSPGLPGTCPGAYRDTTSSS